MCFFREVKRREFNIRFYFSFFFSLPTQILIKKKTGKENCFSFIKNKKFMLQPPDRNEDVNWRRCLRGTMKKLPFKKSVENKLLSKRNQQKI